MAETALLIEELHQWWGQKWEKHHAHEAMSKLNHPSAYLRPGKPSLLRRIGIELPSIGYDRIVEVEKYFNSAKEMINATEEEWLKIPGIGKITAKNVVREVNQ
jgi:ERCC4-type nuclease